MCPIPYSNNFKSKPSQSSSLYSTQHMHKAFGFNYPPFSPSSQVAVKEPTCVCSVGSRIDLYLLIIFYDHTTHSSIRSLDRGQRNAGNSILHIIVGNLPRRPLSTKEIRKPVHWQSCRCPEGSTPLAIFYYFH